MRPTTGSISELTLTARRRLNRLHVLSVRLDDRVSSEDRRRISYIVIEAANLWAEYGRCLFLSCALGARDASGQPIVPQRVRTVDAALTLAVYAVRPKLRGTQQRWKRHQLPDFQNKGDLAKTIRYVQATVFPDVDLAISYQSRVLADLPTMRNFFAHKGESAARAARGLAPRYGLSRTLAPEQLLCTVSNVGAGDILLREWLADLDAILGLMP